MNGVWLGPVVAAISGGAWAWCVREIVLSRRVEAWPTSLGWVERVRVERWKRNGSESVADAVVGLSSGNFFLRIAYRYTVAGEQYRGWRIRFGLDEGFSTEEEARSQSECYGVGVSLPVYYHPRRPSQSALQPGTSLATLLGALVSAVVVIASISWAWLAR